VRILELHLRLGEPIPLKRRNFGFDQPKGARRLFAARFSFIFSVASAIWSGKSKTTLRSKIGLQLVEIASGRIPIGLQHSAFELLYKLVKWDPIM
jgi:hypothetical protein